MINLPKVFTMAFPKSWLSIPSKSPFSIANIPFGIISTAANKTPRPAVAIGDNALDLRIFAENKGFSASTVIEKEKDVFSKSTLNAFAALGRPFHREVRKYLQEVFTENSPHASLLEKNESLRQKALIQLKDVETHLPLEIGDYTDFFAGRNHAFNVGTLFRGPENALQPNYEHIPVAYHGRASSVVVSGTALKRPWGQILQDPKAEPKVPIFTPCRRLDIELELGMFVSRGNELGDSIDVNKAHEHIFGYVLMNDWSARDIQTWEYVPLGPFNAKNFGTTISPWVVLADALEPFSSTGLQNTTQLQSYLQETKKNNAIDINLEVDLKSKFFRVMKAYFL
jgi:fumarylacetoacetase